MAGTKSRRKIPLNNLVVVSDIHAGCRLALCPPDGAQMDDGGIYTPSKFQLKIGQMWDDFWDKFVPEATRDEPYGIVINGDLVEGIHHRSVTPISHNMEDQRATAIKLLSPLRSRVWEDEFYVIRGTEAHSGASANDEEAIAKAIGAKPNKEGQYARWELWKEIGDKKLIHFLHHIGTTGSQSYESTALHKELMEEFIEAARWRRTPPDAIVRSHRHRHFETVIATGSDSGDTGRALGVITPAWQGKTPYTWKIPGARLSTPQFGGVVIRFSHNRLFCDSKVWTIERSETE